MSKEHDESRKQIIEEDKYLFNAVNVSNTLEEYNKILSRVSVLVSMKAAIENYSNYVFEGIEYDAEKSVIWAYIAIFQYEDPNEGRCFEFYPSEIFDEDYFNNLQSQYKEVMKNKL